MPKFELYLTEATYTVDVDSQMEFDCDVIEIAEGLQFHFDQWHGSNYHKTMEAAVVAFVETQEAVWLEELLIPETIDVEGRVY